MEKATIKNKVKLTNEMKRSLLILSIDINSKDLTKEKKALNRIVQNRSKTLSIEYAKNLLDYVEKTETIKGLSKLRCMDTINLLSKGYCVR